MIDAAAPPPAASTAAPGIGRLHMRPDEARLFRARLAGPPGCYLEWGLGGSTGEALRAGAGLVVSVESDAAWIAAARTDPLVSGAEATGRLRLVHADIGPTGKWGAPTDPGSRPIWPGYAEAPWPVLAAAGAWPDLVLVDGRFRVACCLAVAREALARPGQAPPILMMHDMLADRPHYRDAEFAWRQVDGVASLRVYRLRTDLDPEALEAALGRRALDPR